MFRRSLGAIAITVLLSALLSAAASAQNTGSVSGLVTDGLGAPLQDIQVCATSDSLGGFGNCAFSGSDGTYVIPSLVTAPDYRVEFIDNTGTYVAEFFDDTGTSRTTKRYRE